MIRSFLALAVALATLPALAATAPPAVTHFTLSNGLEVVVVPDRRTPVVTHMLWYKVGSADEPAGKSGIAHFLEHLMFKGTARNPAGRFSQTLAAIGGQENAFTSTDYTGYFQRVAKEHLPMLMEFEADRMTGLVLTEDNVKPELNVVLEEQNQRVANNPAARLGEQVSAALYLNHPYGRPIIGWRHEIEALTREDALHFYRRFYVPENAALVVAGDVTVEQVKDLVEKTYGKIPRRGETRVRRRPQEPPQSAARQVTLADARVAQPSLQRSYLVPPGNGAHLAESDALDVLAHILGTGSTSRLYRALVVERNLATNAGAWYQDGALDPTRFGVYATPRTDVTLEKLEQALDDVLAEVVAKGVTEQELTRARNRMVADYVYAQDNQSTLARLYGAALTTGSTVDEVLTKPSRIRAVTAQAVQEAARKYLDKVRSVTGYLVKEAEKRS
jgi:zinc protease